MNGLQFLSRYPHARPRAYLYAISGDQQSLRDECLRRIRYRHRPDAPFDYTQTTTKHQAGALDQLTIPPIGRQRLVEVGDFEDWRDRDIVSQWLATRTSATTVAVLLSTRKSPDTKNPLAQAIIKKGWWVVCARPNRDALKEWLVKAYRLPEDLADRTIDAAGLDLSRIKNMLAKLAFYTGGKMPTVGDLMEVSPGYTPSVFLLVDAILEGKPAKAAELLDAESPHGVLTLLRRRTQTLIAVRQAAIRGDPYKEVADQTGIPAFLIPAVMEKAKGIPFDRLARILDSTARAEIDLTVNRKDPRLVLRRILLETRIK